MPVYALLCDISAKGHGCKADKWFQHHPPWGKNIKYTRTKSDALLPKTKPASGDFDISKLYILLLTSYMKQQPLAQKC